MSSVFWPIENGTAGVGIGVGACVGVRVNVAVAVSVGVIVGVFVIEGVNVGVEDGVSVGVLVKVGVREGVHVFVGVKVTTVGESVGVAVFVIVGVAVNVGVRVLVVVGVTVIVGVCVKVGVGVGSPAFAEETSSTATCAHVEDATSSHVGETDVAPVVSLAAPPSIPAPVMFCQRNVCPTPCTDSELVAPDFESTSTIRLPTVDGIVSEAVVPAPDDVCDAPTAPTP